MADEVIKLNSLGMVKKKKGIMSDTSAYILILNRKLPFFSSLENISCKNIYKHVITEYNNNNSYHLKSLYIWH